MTQQQVQVFRAALEKLLTNAKARCHIHDCSCGTNADSVTEAIAALAATAEPVNPYETVRVNPACDSATAEPAKPVADLVRQNATSAFTGKPIRSEVELQQATEAVMRAKQPSPAPRDAEREALLAFGEKVREACALAFINPLDHDHGKTRLWACVACADEQRAAEKVRAVPVSALLPVRK